jgi:hypothetical protein
MYSKKHKRNIVDDLSLENIEYKYNTNLIFVNYKLYFKTNTNENIIFNMMGTIFYNNIELKTFETRINIYTDDRGMAHAIIKNDTENLRKELNNFLKDMSKNGDSCIIYLDSNNLYGSSMIQHMPTSNFKWNYKHDNEELNKEKWTKERILKLGDRDPIGYLFDVNISYPTELHDLMNQYGICPENISIKKDYLNEWQKKNNESKITKLCCT